MIFTAVQKLPDPRGTGEEGGKAGEEKEGTEGGDGRREGGGGAGWVGGWGGWNGRWEGGGGGDYVQRIESCQHRWPPAAPRQPAASRRRRFRQSIRICPIRAALRAGGGGGFRVDEVAGELEAARVAPAVCV